MNGQQNVKIRYPVLNLRYPEKKTSSQGNHSTVKLSGMVNETYSLLAEFFLCDFIQYLHTDSDIVLRNNTQPFPLQ